MVSGLHWKHARQSNFYTFLTVLLTQLQRTPRLNPRKRRRAGAVDGFGPSYIWCQLIILADRSTRNREEQSMLWNEWLPSV